MIYISETGIEFLRAFHAVQYAMRAGCKVGIYKNGKFLRWLC